MLNQVCIRKFTQILIKPIDKPHLIIYIIYIKPNGANMKLLTSYTYGDDIDGDLIPVCIMAHGETIDDLLPAMCSDIGETLAMDDIKETTIEDNEGNPIDATIDGVKKAINDGATTIMVKQTYRCDLTTRTDVYTINNFNP